MNGKRIVIFGWASSVHIQRWCRALRDKGWTIRLISLGGEKLDNIDTIIFPRESQLSYFKYAEQAAQKANEFEPDLIHVHYVGGFGIWGMKTKFKPTVVSVWGSDIVTQAQKFHYRLFIKQSLKRADHITSSSEFLKEQTIKLTKKAQDKISMIPFGVNLPDLQPLPEQTPLKLCFIKGHRSIYGPEFLLKALARAKKQIPEIKLTFAGEGEITDQLKALTQQLDLVHNVEFAGFIPNEKMAEFITAHHIMVMPSLQESFGVAALETSACARPVIATTVGGIPEVVEHGKTGLLISPQDEKALAEAIVKLGSDFDLIQKMGESGRQFVSDNFQWEKNVNSMVELYERLINEK